ncbi:NnrU family protein [Propionivibrio sp.]|uniref:NnrU family protein n=1 Tax=Propionivibrio sp. TaxID=2212460 RepID=UPI003BF21524
MWMFVSGLVLFFALHFTTATPPVRESIARITGENAWKGLVALGSLSAVFLISFGWKYAPNTVLFAPSPFAILWAPVLVSIAMVLFVIGGGNLSGYIRRTLHHPMLVGVIIWSITHLLANGGLRETLFFGAFLVFSVYALGSLLLAGKRATFKPLWKWDAIGLGIGLFVAIGVMHSHKWLFGVAVS